MFSSLHVRNFRLYFTGQILSISGIWMRTVAQAWLVLRLTDSGVAVGVVTTLQYLPLFLGATWASRVVDRFDRRRLLIVTQAVMATLTAALWIASASGRLTMVGIYAYSAAYGLVQPFDNPARRLFVLEMVGAERLSNAVGLNAAVFTTGQMIGPAIGGVLIAISGVSICFFLGTLSFVAILVALLRMHTDELLPPPSRGDSESPESTFSYLARTPDVCWPIVLTAVASALLLNYPVILPLLAERVYGVGPAMFGAMFAVLSVGSVAGALLTAARRRPRLTTVVFAAAGFGTAAMLVAGAPTLAIGMAALALLGVSDQLFSANSGTFIQIRTSPPMRARIVALYSSLFVGSKGLSGIIAGVLAEAMGPRKAMAIAGATTVAVALLAMRWALSSSTSQIVADSP